MKKKNPVTFELEAELAPETRLPFWTREKCLARTEIRTLDLHPVVDNFILYNRIK
jgi:hypothetical protein